MDNTNKNLPIAGIQIKIYIETFFLKLIDIATLHDVHYWDHVNWNAIIVILMYRHTAQP